MPKPQSPGRRAALLGALMLPALRVAPAWSQAAWPTGNVRLVVPFGAGGAVDTLSRTVANAFPTQAGGQTLVVENRAGAGGTIAGAVVAQARPDGVTLMMADLGANAIGKELQPSLPYDPMRAFAPVCHLVNLPLALVVPAASPAKTLAEFIALSKRDPEMVYSHPGIGYVGHLAQELFMRETGTRATPVPYRSGAEVVRSLLANETQSSFITVSTSLPFLRDGRLRALAVASPARVALLPEVPALTETLPGFVAMVWHGILAPAGTPPEIIAAANQVFNAVIQLPEVKRVVEQTQAGEVAGGSPEQFASFIQAEYARWAPLIRSANIRTQ